MRSFSEEATLSGANTPLAFSPDGTLLATSLRGEGDRGRGTVIRLWNTATGTETKELHGHKNSLRSLGFSADGTAVLSGTMGSGPSEIKVWDTRTGEATTVDAGGDVGVEFVSLTPSGRYLIAVIGLGRIISSTLVFELGEGTPARVTIKEPEAFPRVAPRDSGGNSGALESIALGLSGLGSVGSQEPVFSPDRTRFVATESKKLLLCDSADMRPSAVFGVPWKSPSSPTFSPDGTLLAAAGTRIPSGGGDLILAGQEVRLWDLKQGHELANLRGCQHPVFSPDGRYLATEGSTLHSVRLWDVRPRKPIGLLLLLSAMPPALVVAVGRCYRFLRRRASSLSRAGSDSPT
jgi:WD40 repeat protein